MKPWEKYAQQAQQPAQGPWTKYAQQPAPPASSGGGASGSWGGEGQGVANNVAQMAGDGLFMGLGDEISARLNALTGYDAATGTYGNDTSYADQLAAVRGQESQFREDHPVAALGAEIGGALVPGAGAAGLVGRAATVPGRVASGAAIGGGMGAVQGFMEGEGGLDGRVESARNNALIGGAVGAAIPAVGAGVRSLAQGRAVNRAARGALSSAELKAAGREAYRAVDDAGVEIKPEAFDRLRGQALDTLRNNTGYDELPGVGVTPRTARVMQTMDEASAQMAQDPTAALPWRSLDQTRRRAGAAARDFTNDAEKAAGTALIREIDDFVQKLGPDDVVGGDVDALKSAIGKARDLWSQARKSELIDNAIDQSENYVSGGASGVRNQLARILRNKSLSSGFNDAERSVLRRVINGGFLEQAIHVAGGRLGQTATTVLGSGLGGGAGGFLGGAAGATAGAAIAGGARVASNALAMRGIEGARALINSGALRDPAVMNALANAGRTPEAIANTGMFGALNALTGR